MDRRTRVVGKYLFPASSATGSPGVCPSAFCFPISPGREERDGLPLRKKLFDGGELK